MEDIGPDQVYLNWSADRSNKKTQKQYIEYAEKIVDNFEEIEATWRRRERAYRSIKRICLITLTTYLMTLGALIWHGRRL